MQVEPGTRVLITGASRGIGEALARAFAARGCVLGLVARSEAELESLARSLPGEGHAALPADVADPGSISAAVERFGQVDVLVANAGVAHYGPFQEQELELAERMTRVNWLGTLYTVKAALPRMLDRARGQIVIVSSGASHRAFPFAAVYGATKAAQSGFAEALRQELSGSGVSVTTVYPGEVQSHLHDHQPDRLPDWNDREKNAAPAEPLAQRVVAAVERDARSVHYPPAVAALRVVQVISPRLADRVVRAARGKTAAPRL
jgi:short-subunit dehydrogenase